MRVVLTNDDGVDAPGLRALALACRSLGHDVLVVAPSEDLSGAGAAIGRIRADQRIGTRRSKRSAASMRSLARAAQADRRIRRDGTRAEFIAPDEYA